MGYEFKGADADKWTVISKPDGGELKYKLVNVCEFTSKRKRMSCIYETEDGEYILMTKGADSVIKDECLASHAKEGVLF